MKIKTGNHCNPFVIIEKQNVSIVIFYPKHEYMKKRTIKKIAIWTLSVSLLLVMVLAFHIWWVYHPRVSPFTKVMARIDIREPINQADAGRISSWLYHQKGVDHVLVNPDSRIAVFTFFPSKVSGEQIVSRFKEQLPYPADRFMPTQTQLAHSCPVAGSSFYYKVYKFIDNIL